MLEPFAWNEIYKESPTLNNNKSSDDNGLQSEHIKYALKELHHDIVIILDKVSETVTYTQEFEHGVIITI